MPIPRFVCTFRELTVLRWPYRTAAALARQSFTFPINPESYQLTQGRSVEELSIVGYRDVPRIGNRKLEKVSFEAVLPGRYDHTLCNYSPIVPPGESYARLRRWATSAGGEAAVPLRVTIPGFYTGTMILTDADLSTQPSEERSDIHVSIQLMTWIELQARTFTYALPAKASSAQKGGARYTVVAGDTLWGIARKFYGAGSEWRRIWAANKPMRSGNPNRIFVGEVITIPKKK